LQPEVARNANLKTFPAFFCGIIFKSCNNKVEGIIAKVFGAMTITLVAGTIVGGFSGIVIGILGGLGIAHIAASYALGGAFVAVGVIALPFIRRATTIDPQ
jgi:hypothetical protein